MKNGLVGLDDATLFTDVDLLVCTTGVYEFSIRDDTEHTCIVLGLDSIGSTVVYWFEADVHSVLNLNSIEDDADRSAPW